MIRRHVALACLALLLPLPAVAQGLTVFAAASLTESLQEVGAAWAKQGHPGPRFSFASSSTLARQIEAGAPANLFASADEQWANELDKQGLLAPGTRIDLLSNQLVIIVPKEKARHISIGPGFDIAALLGPDGRLSVGDPAHVPVGIYAEQALRKLGVWSTVEPRLARTEDVRSGMRLVELGEAPAGIVYATDAAASDKVMIAGIFPPSSHDPITYPFAVVKANDTPDARALLSFMHGREAKAIFTKRGFSPVE